MKKLIEALIVDYVSAYAKREDIHTEWGVPIVGFAAADDPYIQNLPALIGPNHGTPQEVLVDASIVIAYFVPFTKELADSNKTGNLYSSPEWARAYEETNAMLGECNEYLIEELTKRGIKAGVSPKAATFSQEELVSDWSQRHFAYAAGVGTFGINNMLITKRGCCGRYSTVVTDLDVTPDERPAQEYCLYKRDGSCKVCIRNCPAGALSTEGYDRFRCYPILQENARKYTQFGSSYVNEDGEGANSVGSEVCGKCVTQSPCAFWNM